MRIALGNASRTFVLTLVLVALPAATRAEAQRFVAGAEEVTDDEQHHWKPSPGFVGGQAVSRGPIAILTNQNAALYRQEREAVTGFSLATGPGRFLVSIHMVENDPKCFGRGKRVMDIDVGGTVLRDLDVWHLATGEHVPLIYAVPVTVRGKTLPIRFRARRGKTTVSAIEVTPLPDVPATVAPDETVAFDPASFAASDPQLRKVAKSDDRSGAISARIDRASASSPAFLRVDYRVDASLPYAARATLDLAVTADLTGRSSVRMWVLPDGSRRRAALELRDEEGHVGSIGLDLSGTDPVELRFPLEQMGSDVRWFNRPTGSSLARRIASMRVVVDAANNLGGGSIAFGPLRASSERVAPHAAPPGPDEAQVSPKRWRIEGFETYRSTAELRRAYGFIPHEGMAIFTLDERPGAPGKKAMRIDYSFGKRHHAGFTILREMDLAPYNVLRLWLRGDGGPNKLRVFDATGGYFKTEIPLGGPEGRVVDLPFSDWLGFTAAPKGRIELGFWAVEVPGGPRSGTYWVDDIELVQEPKYPLGFAKAPAPTPLPPGDVVRIDAGSLVDSKDGHGNVWLSDRGAYWGNPKRYGDDEPLDYKGPLAPLFATERYGMAGYGFAVPNGAYEVELMFGETWAGALAPGRRVCAVSVNGAPQSNVDIIAETKRRFVPMTRRYPVSVSDGKIEVLFRGLANHCKVDALVIKRTP